MSGAGGYHCVDVEAGVVRDLGQIAAAVEGIDDMSDAGMPPVLAAVNDRRWVVTTNFVPRPGTAEARVAEEHVDSARRSLLQHLR